MHILSKSFKVTDASTSRKPVCDLPLENNTNLHPVPHRFPVTATDEETETEPPS